MKCKLADKKQRSISFDNQPGRDLEFPTGSALYTKRLKKQLEKLVSFTMGSRAADIITLKRQSAFVHARTTLHSFMRALS